jgi:hypothetical protein
VVKTEEKGSAVNLASFLLLDAFHAEYEVAAVIWNDSDLALPIRLVREELGLRVGILNPSGERGFAVDLAKVATFKKQLREGVLSVSQFPEVLSDENGEFREPASW